MRASVTTLSILLLSAAACGGTTASSPTSDAGESDTGIDTGAPDAATDVSAPDAHVTPDAGAPGSRPPPDPGGPAPNGMTDVVLAIEKLYVGDTDRQGVTSITAWKQYGFDIDGKTTDKTSTDVCTLSSGAARASQADGVNGIDNSFGENILPIFLTVAGQDFARKANAKLSSGSASTILFEIPNVGTGPSYSPLPGKSFVGAPLGANAAWNGNDVWPIDSSSVNGSVSSPVLAFSGAYMNNRVWVGAPAQSANLPLMFADSTPVLVSALTIAMTIAPDGRSASGTISGVLPTEAYVNAFKTAAGRISTSLCQGSAVDSVAQQIRQASDILRDGSNLAGVPCDAISIGLGFDATIVKLGAVVTPPSPPNPCP
jgi:hypothetical protein